MKLFVCLPFSTVHSLPPLSSAIAKSICILKHRHLSSETHSRRGDGCAVLALSVQTIVVKVLVATAIFYSISNSFWAWNTNLPCMYFLCFVPYCNILYVLHMQLQQELHWSSQRWHTLSVLGSVHGPCSRAVNMEVCTEHKVLRPTRHKNNNSIDVVSIAAVQYINGLAIQTRLECGPMPNLMAALPNIGGALCLTPQSLADAHY